MIMPVMVRRPGAHTHPVAKSVKIAKVRDAVERYRAAQSDVEAEGNAGLAALLALRADTHRSR